jgi:hypothetical protein
MPSETILHSTASVAGIQSLVRRWAISEAVTFSTLLLAGDVVLSTISTSS